MKRYFYTSFICTVCLFASAFRVVAQETMSGFGKQVFKKYWMIESESPDYQVKHLGDTLEITSPKGLTLWHKEKMKGNVVIEYDACVMDEGKAGDRLSDLNCFWMATDPEADSVFDRLDQRNGVFKNQAQLSLYYVGYGGNHNSTTRFRRYDGNPGPAILGEYTDAEHLLTPNKWYHIKLVSSGNIVQYWIDGQKLFELDDPQPHKEGWFGFRTTLSRTAIKNFKYTTN